MIIFNSGSYYIGGLLRGPYINGRIMLCSKPNTMVILDYYIKV